MNLKSKLLTGLEERKRKLRDEAESFDISQDSHLETQQAKVSTRKTTRMASKYNNSNAEVATAALVMGGKDGKRGKKKDMLVLAAKEQDAFEDVNAIRKVSFTCGLTSLELLFLN